MKALVSLLIAAVAILGWVLYRDEAILKSQSLLQAQLEDKLKAATEARQSEQQTASLDYQAKCAEQAKRAYEDMGYKSNSVADYENHYNASLNKCFVQLESTDARNPNMIWTHRSVLDAFEGKPYAEYDWHTVKDKKYWDVPPFRCHVILLTGEDRVCKSDGEYQELIKNYMGK